MQNILLQMKDFLRARHVPTSLSNKISTFYSMAARKQVLEDDQLLSGLSTQLRTELLMFLYRKTLDKVPFFQVCEYARSCLQPTEYSFIQICNNYSCYADLAIIHVRAKIRNSLHHLFCA